MNIETLLSDLAASIKENTAVLREVLAASAVRTPEASAAQTPAEEPAKPAKAKAPAKAAKPEPTPEPVVDAEQEAPAAEPEPEVETPAAATPADDEGWEPVLTAPELLVQITETVKHAIVGAKDSSVVKDKWSAIRKQFGVEKISDLTDVTQLTEALAMAKTL